MNSGSQLSEMSTILEVFSQFIGHRHCLCLFVGQVMFSHHSDQMSQRPQVFRMSLCVPKSKLTDPLTLEKLKAMSQSWLFQGVL